MKSSAFLRCRIKARCPGNWHTNESDRRIERVIDGNTGIEDQIRSAFIVWQQGARTILSVRFQRSSPAALALKLRAVAAILFGRSVRRLINWSMSDVQFFRLLNPDHHLSAKNREPIRKKEGSRNLHIYASESAYNQGLFPSAFQVAKVAKTR